MGRYTQKGNTVYAHIYETPLGALPLYGISPQEVGTITFLSSGAQVQRGEAWNTAMYSDTPFVALGENPVFSYPLPDEIDTVLKIELKNRTLHPKIPVVYYLRIQPVFGNRTTPTVT